MNVFGLKFLGRKIASKLKVTVENKNNPDEWNWVPNNPEKIKNLFG